MTTKSNDVRLSMAQVFKAVEYANEHPDRYLSGTTNWCAAVAFCLNRQIIEAQPADQQGEPVAWLDEDSGALATAKLKTCMEDGFEIPLYRHAQPATPKVVLPELDEEFEKWWQEDGQYCRAGGGSYEKTFAYRAYESAISKIAKLNGGQS